MVEIGMENGNQTSIVHTGGAAIELRLHVLGELIHYTPELVVQFLGPSSLHLGPSSGCDKVIKVVTGWRGPMNTMKLNHLV